MACVSGQAWLQRLVRGPRRQLEQRILEELQIALSLDDNDADVHRILAALKLNFNEHDKAAYHQETRARASIRTAISSSFSRANC